MEEKKTTSLRSLIQNNVLRGGMFPVILLEVILLALYFVISAWIVRENSTLLIHEVKRDLPEILLREAEIINTQLGEISRSAQYVQLQHERFFAEFYDGCDPVLPNPPEFGFYPTGAFYKVEDNGGSSVYFPATTPLGKRARRLAANSEVLDPLLKKIVTLNPVVTQAYINTRDNMNRLYPFMQDAPRQFEPQNNVRNFNFYTLADSEHNPGRGPVWTPPYLDPAGQGWIISSLVPVYYRDRLEGVSGFDVKVDVFARKVLDLKSFWGAQSFLVTQRGDIIAMSDEMKKILGLGEITKPLYDNPIAATVEQPKSYNLLNNPNREKTRELVGFFKSDTPLQTITVDGVRYIVHKETVEETGWRIIALVDLRLLLKGEGDLRGQAAQAGFLALLVILILDVLLYRYMRRHAGVVASQLTAPIIRLSQRSSDIVAQQEYSNVEWEPLTASGIIEIDTLNKNFNEMVSQLDQRSTELVAAELQHRLEEEKAEHLENLATTDSLTKIFNRYKLSQVLADEIRRCQRSLSSFGVIMLDLDHFKRVNDTWGHPVGDQVLQGVAGQLVANARKTDIVGRWGGEEFLVICPDATEDGVLYLAEKFRLGIAGIPFEPAGQVTASFGATLSWPGETLDEIIACADKALYAAKNRGRNRVEVVRFLDPVASQYMNDFS